MKDGDVKPSMQNSSSHIAFKDGTSSEASQPVLETTAPSNTLASIMANWLYAISEPVRVDASPSQKEP